MKSGDMKAIADALDSIEDGTAIADGPEFVKAEVLKRFGSPEAALLAEAITRLVARATGHL